MDEVRATSRRQFTFYHKVPRNSWYSFYRTQKDEGLSQPWSHTLVLNTDQENFLTIINDAAAIKLLRNVLSLLLFRLYPPTSGSNLPKNVNFKS